MFPIALVLLLLGAGIDGPALPRGTIQGVVVNGTKGNEPLADVAVILQVGPEAALAPVAETRTDIYGKFAFEDLPLDPSTTYLPGAQRDGVYYPGDRVRLGLSHRVVQAKIVAFDTIESPSPLITERHDIEINCQTDLMEISETMVISNPAAKTYAGKQIDDKPRITLQLSIPPNFDRVTFRDEFYGRRFRVVDHKPVTDIPWPPGHRELKFVYRIPLEKSAGVFRRRLDLPCGNVRVRVSGENAGQVSCNLPRSANAGDHVEFATNEKGLTAGFNLELQVGKRPIPWMLYARWSSLGALCALAFGTIALKRHRGR